MHIQNVSMIKRAVIATVILVLYSLGFSHAYYKQSHVPSQWDWASPGVFNNPDKVVPSMVIRDHLATPFVDKIFLPGLPSLFSIDEINVSRVVVDFKRLHLPEETALTNLLYANLKLNMLVREYEKLQSDARLEISRYRIPYLDILTVDTTPDEESTSLASRSSRIERLYESVMRSKGMNSQVRTLVHAAGAYDSSTPVDEQARGRDQALETYDVMGGDANYHSDGRNGSFDPLVSHNTAQNGHDNHNEMESGQTADNGNVAAISWGVRFFLGIVEYFYDNKIEATIYLTIIAFLLSLFLSSRSR